jgi:membrane-associated phospholipid phosphatase
LDKEIALFVKATWLSTKRLSFSSTNIPDLLSPLVCAVTAISWGAYFTLAHKRVHNTQTQFFLLVACAVPIAFILKSILKYVFGRINARFWVVHPGFKDFHWFNGTGCYTGFPSGHMAVFTVLALALWRFYPRYRFAYAGFLWLLALALIITDYHFLSDVIAGIFLGLAVHGSVLYGLAVVRNGHERKGAL